jgi:hypothetical protein
MAKAFKLAPSEIEPLIADAGSCRASDRIVVDGRPVGLMYREKPQRPDDSGWRFLAGDEDDAYSADADHFGIYALNTIANYDPRIIPLLPSPVGSAFRRDPRTGGLTRADDWEASPLG